MTNEKPKVTRKAWLALETITQMCALVAEDIHESNPEMSEYEVVRHVSVVLREIADESDRVCDDGIARGVPFKELAKEVSKENSEEE